MKRTYLFAIVLLPIIAFYTGCKKADRPHPGGDHPGCSVMWAHIERFPGLQSTPQSFTIPAGTPQSFTAANGTKFNFYPNSFKDQDGNIITSGTITITLTEAYTPGSVIANRSSTYYRGNMLQTGGQVSVMATMNGNVLTANKYGIAFKQSAATALDMGLFYGTMDNPDSSANWTDFNNTSVGSNTIGTTIEKLTDNSTDGTATGNYYRFDSCTHFGYVAAGRLMSAPEVTNINVKMTDDAFAFSLQNTEVYIISRSTNSAMLCYSFTYSTQLFNMTNPYDGYIGQIPVGTVVDLVAISFRNNNYYYSHKSGITVTKQMSSSISDFMTVPMDMTEQTEAFVKADLASF